MSGSQAPKTGLDDAASIKAFLASISHAVKPHLSTPRSKDIIEQVGELKIRKEGNNDAPDTEANGAVNSIIESTAAINVASPEAEQLDTIPAEKVSEWIHVNAPPDHSKPKNPLLAAGQAQDSPQVSGVRAPPPTPETVSNVAIGQLLMNVLDDIPQDRLLSLGDSMHAPKNYSKLRYNRSTAASQPHDQFFSPVPQSSKPRHDASFTRMSFKAAEIPNPPVFSLPDCGNKPATDPKLPVQGQPPAAKLKENIRLKESFLAWTKGVEIDRSMVSTPATPKVTPATPRLKPAPAGEVKVSKIYTPDGATAAATIYGSEICSPDTAGIPDDPPPPPRLKPVPGEDAEACRVNTPDVPDRPLNINLRVVADQKTPLQPHYPRASPFPVNDIPRSTAEVEEVNKPARPIAIAKSFTGVSDGGLEISTPGRPITPGGGLLTPASMTFGVVSPQSVKAAGITTASMPGKVVGEDLEGALYFKAWPKVEQRATRTAARVRKIMLTGIPTGSTANLVASFVFGGPLERIHVGDSSSAFVTFLRGEDAAKYYEATGNGLDYKKDDAEHVIMTEMTNEVNPVSGVLREYIEKEFTRCVRAIGVDKERTTMALHEMAAAKGRKVEKIVDGLNMRSVNFRFCDISDAVKFKQMLSRSEDWEECNIHFAPDPCAAATGIHFD
ncbi:MAG: hypothetical protein Q9171_000866 [Xanthocarpia ochracea]